MDACRIPFVPQLLRSTPPFEPPVIYEGTGETTPDANGLYVEDGTWNGQKCFLNDAAALWLFWDINEYGPDPGWWIAPIKMPLPPNGFIGGDTAEDRIGLYSSYGTYSGDVQISEES